MKEQIVTKKHSLPEKQFEQMFVGSPFTDAQKLYAYRFSCTALLVAGVALSCF